MSQTMISASISALYAGVYALLLIALSFRVIQLRVSNRVGLGDGENEILQRAIRAQGNFTEYAPIAIILMLIAEINGISSLYLHIFGLIFLTARLIHAIAFSSPTGKIWMRVVAMQLTLWSLAIMAILLISQVVLNHF